MEDDDGWRAPQPDVPPAVFPKFTKPLLSLSFGGPQPIAPTAPANDPFLLLATSLGFAPLPSMVVRTVSVDSGDFLSLPPQPTQHLPHQQQQHHMVVEEADEEAEPAAVSREESEQFFDAPDKLPAPPREHVAHQSSIFCAHCLKVNPVGTRFCSLECEHEHSKPFVLAFNLITA